LVRARKKTVVGVSLALFLVAAAATVVRGREAVVGCEEAEGKPEELRWEGSEQRGRRLEEWWSEEGR
jgi:hypothetical protein